MSLWNRVSTWTRANRARAPALAARFSNWRCEASVSLRCFPVVQVVLQFHVVFLLCLLPGRRPRQGGPQVGYSTYEWCSIIFRSHDCFVSKLDVLLDFQFSCSRSDRSRHGSDYYPHWQGTGERIPQWPRLPRFRRLMRSTSALVTVFYFDKCRRHEEASIPLNHVLMCSLYSTAGQTPFFRRNLGMCRTRSSCADLHLESIRYFSLSSSSAQALPKKVHAGRPRLPPSI